MAFNLSNILRTSSRKSDVKSISAATSLDRPSAPKGFAHIMKGSSPMVTDPSVRAFHGNSAYSTRLGGMKPW